MMELPRSASPASSLASSLDSNGLPIGRIKCSKDKIFIGDRHYQSATDALLAYLRQFETASADAVAGGGGRNGASSSTSSRGSSRGGTLAGTNGTSDGETTPRSNLSADLDVIGVDNKKDEVQQLLTSKVCPELKEEVTDTLREIKLKNLLKKAVSKSQKPGKTGLQQEVEAALARSAQLLEKVTMEDIQSTKNASEAVLADSISDISLPTQLLLADVNNSLSNNSLSNNSTDSVRSQDLEEDVVSGRRKNGHIYPYHTPSDYLNRSLNSSGLLLLSPNDILHNPHNLRQSRQRHRHLNLSHDDLTFTSSLRHNRVSSPHQRLLSNSSASSNSSSKFSEHNNTLSDNLRRIRSRSVPPNAIRNETETSRLMDRSNTGFNRPTNVPSWVNEAGLNSSLMFSAETSKPAIPQWVEDVAKSDISVDNILTEHNSRLATSSKPIYRRSKDILLSNSNSFSKSEGDLSSWRDDLSKLEMSLALSNPISNHHHSHSQPPSEKHVTFTDNPSSPSSTGIPKASLQPTHSTPLRGRRGQKATPEVLVNGHTSISASDDVRKTLANGADGSDVDSDLKSSSLDTLALLTGKPHTRHRGPNILSGNSLGSRIFPDTPLLSSIEQDRTALTPSPTDSHNGAVTSSDGLDGDRSWEKHTNNFKPPVPVGNCDRLMGHDASDGVKKNSCSSLSGGNQPGSMETLKNMLFKLQKEDPSVTASDGADTDRTPDNPSGLPALQDYDFQTEPGGHSLEKALHHLDRLKTLVKNTPTNGQGDMLNGAGEKESSSSIV